MFVAKRLIVLLAALLLALPSLAWAGSTGKLSGSVVDAKTSEPLPGAAVGLDVGGVQVGAQTDADGRFVILNIPPGTYSVKVRLIGYKTTTITDVLIVTDKSSLIEAKLEESLLTGDSVTVIAPRENVKLDEVQNTRTLTSQQIEALPFSDVQSILATQVGVVIRGGEIHIRGGRSNEVSYIVDGVETRDPLGGLGATDIGINLNSSSLEEVQIIKSGFDPEYGNATSGVVKVTTKEGDYRLTQGRIEYWTDNFRVPELNKYSFNRDEVRINISGPEPLFAQRLLPALGMDYLKDKLAYSVTLNAYKTNGFLDFNKFTPALDQRGYERHRFLGLEIADRQFNTYDFTSKVSCKLGSLKMILNYQGTWDRYNPFDAYSWDYRYTPGTIARVEENKNVLSLTLNQQLNTKTFYEVVLSRFSNSYLQVPDDPNNPGKGLYPDDFLLYDQWEYYVDQNNNGRYDAPEPFLNETGDTVYFWGGPQYTSGDALGYSAFNYWVGSDQVWNSGVFNPRLVDTLKWDKAQSTYDTLFWDWDHDGFIDNTDAEAYADQNGNGKWDAGDLLFDTNGNGRYDYDRGQSINVDQPEPYIDGDQVLGEPFIDLNANGKYDEAIDIFVMSTDPSVNMDLNRNSKYDGPSDAWTPGVPYKDLNGNGLYDGANGVYDYGESFVDINHSGKWDAKDGFFDTGHNQWAFYQKRGVTKYTVDFKLTRQLIQELQLKTGFQVSYNEVSMADLRYPEYPYDNPIVDGGPWPDRGVFRDFYTRYPSEGAFFTQFKLEYGTLKASLGARVDFFLQSDNVSRIIDQEDLAGKQLVDDRVKISPRVGISYPITEKAKVYFNYGHFYQLPEYQYMYRRATQASNAFGIVGNFNLDYTKNIQYEVGVSYQLSNDYVLDVAGFYKDFFGLINSTRQTYGPFQRNEYENSDYARTRGFEVELRKTYGHYVSGNLTYTYAFAYGKSSSESSNYFDDFYNRSIPIQEFPLSWDVRNQLSLNLSIGIPKADKPYLFGMRIPNAWSLAFIWDFGTGYPFTPSRDYPGLKLLPGEQPLTNSLRYPPSSNVDMRFQKDFALIGLDYTFELWVTNLFNTRNYELVYSNTGRPDTNTNISGIVVEGADSAKDPSNYGPGRNIRVGLALNF